MKIKMNQLTYHAKEERRDRREIVKQVGIGRPIAQIKKFSDDGREKTESLQVGPWSKCYDACTSL